MKIDKIMRTILCSLLLLMGTVAFAQESEQPSVVQNDERIESVVLKNGRIVQGKIIEYYPLQSLKIQKEDGSVEDIKWNRIKVIKKTKRQPKTTFSTQFTEGKGPQKGFRGMVDVGYAFYVGDAITDKLSIHSDHFELNAVGGYQIYPFLFVGVGAGYYRYKSGYTGKPFKMYPIFADVRSDFLLTSISPFLDLRVGYSLVDSKLWLKGRNYFINPSIGARVKIKDRLAFNISLGFEWQGVSYDNMFKTIHDSMHAVSIRGGLEL